MYKDDKRMMAWIGKISDIKPIPDADLICAYHVGGWWVVDSIGKYNLDDLVIYCSTDSWIPYTLAPFLCKGKQPRVYNEIEGERLKTVRLRKQLSQGLILPITEELKDKIPNEEFCENYDLTELLGIQLWERPMPAELSGVACGSFPSFIPKTDQERIQNIHKKIHMWRANNVRWEVTEKLDGSSMTVYSRKIHNVVMDEEILTLGVCSRKIDLQLDQVGNSFVDTAKNSGLLDAMERLGQSIAVQGELYGGTIQKGYYNVPVRFAVFDVWDIEHQMYLSPYDRRLVVSQLQNLGADIDHVPIIHEQLSLGEMELEDILLMAEGRSDINNSKEREGLVFKSSDGQTSFKAISNRFLLKVDAKEQ